MSIEEIEELKKEAHEVHEATRKFRIKVVDLCRTGHLTPDQAVSLFTTPENPPPNPPHDGHP